MRNIKSIIIFYVVTLTYTATGISIKELLDAGSIAHEITNPKELRLNHYNISDLEGIQLVPHTATLEKIDLSQNNLTTLSGNFFSSFPKLKQLFLKHNHINNISNINALAPLNELYLTNNALTIIDLEMLKELPLLYVLDVGYNAIHTVKTNSVGSMPCLEILFLNNNNLTNLPPYFGCSIPQLKGLYLQNNQITQLNATHFIGLEKLKLLYLNNNQLNMIPSNCFDSLKQLHLLYLNNNNLSSLDAGWHGGLEQLEVIDITNNQVAFINHYEQIKQLLDHYQRPITILALGNIDPLLSWYITKQYNCSYIMLNDQTTSPMWLTKNRDNVIILDKKVTLQDLTELALCEHFDVVIAAEQNRIEDVNQNELTAALALLGDYLIELKSGTLLLHNTHKNILTKPTWGSPNKRFYPVQSTFTQKTIYKPRIHKTIPWIKGINLWTFRNLQGSHPQQKIIHDEIKRLSAQPHLDFMPWNMVIQGTNLELIDWDDNNAPTFMHNYEACITQYESETLLN